LKKGEKDGKIAEDESHKTQEKIQKLTDRYIEQIDQTLAAKEKEIMEV
jgi:ribosome recycling factor